MNLLAYRRALMGGGGATPPVHGTWEDLFARISDGTYATAYSVGEILPLDLGAEGVVNAQIVAFNADDKADGNGKAPITFITEHLLSTSKPFNPWSNPQVYDAWSTSPIRAYILNTIVPLFPSSISSRILTVSKKTQGWTNGASASTLVTSSETVWIPSRRELFKNGEASGVDYTAFFNSDAARIKKKNPNASAISWWSRSVSRVTNSTGINIFATGATGAADYYPAVSGSKGIALGFCIG